MFDYLDGCDIYYAFSNLNTRFQQLLTSSSFLLKISLDLATELRIEDCCEHFIAPNRQRILSLRLLDSRVVTGFFNHCTFNAFYSRLESIVIYGISPPYFMKILNYLKPLSRLVALTIHLDYYHDSKVEFHEIYRMIFNFPCLKYNSLSFLGQNKATKLVSFPISERFSNIECLIMTHIYTLNELLPTLYHTPRLNRLDCFYLIESNKNIENEISLTLPNLTYLRIWHCHVKFDKFKLFLKRICSQLRVLNITGCPDVNYMDLNQWKDFTMENMVHLRRFYLTCRIVARSGFDHIYFDTFTDQFYSQFWKEQKWIFKLQIRYQVTFDYILNQYEY